MNENAKNKLKTRLGIVGIIFIIAIAFFFGKNKELEQKLLINDSLVSYTDATIVDLNNELANIRKSKNILEAEFNELKIDNTKLKAKLITINRSLKKVLNEKNRLQKDSIIYAKKIDELQDLILNYQGSKEYLEEVVAARNSEIELLNTRNSELEKKIEKKEQEIYNLKQKVKKLEADRKKLNSKLKEKEKEINNLREKIILIGNKHSKKAKEYQLKIERLIKDKEKLNNTINNKDSVIQDLDNKVPRLYNFRAYYYKEIRQRIPGKIIRRKKLQKDYLDSKMDYAKYVRDIYLKFNINTDEFFKSSNDKLITIELKSNNGQILKQKISLSQDATVYDYKIFTNVNLQKGNYIIEISYDEGGVKIEKYEFKLI